MLAVKYIFTILTINTIRAIIALFSPTFFQLPFSDRHFIPFQLYLNLKGLISQIICGCFQLTS